MKNIWMLIGMLWLVSATSAMAQLESDLPLNERMEAMKVAFITEKIGLTTQQSQQFWPIYNEYQAEQKAIRNANKRQKGILQMTDEDLEKLIFTNLDNEAKLVALKRTYIEKYQEVISIRQVAMLMKAEREFNREVVERLLQLRNNRRGRN